MIGHPNYAKLRASSIQVSFVFLILQSCYLEVLLFLSCLLFTEKRYLILDSFDAIIEMTPSFSFAT